MSTIRSFSVIVAIDEKSGIAKEGKLPWNVSEDMKFFRIMTTVTKDVQKKNAIIMGRKTWDSLPRKPLPDRINLVVSSKLESKDASHLVFPTLSKALEFANNNSQIENIIVIGGEAIYKQAIEMKECGALYVSNIPGDYKCDQFFPAIDNKIWSKFSSSVKDSIPHSIYLRNITYLSKKEEDKTPPEGNSEEDQYLLLLKEILEKGEKRTDRTGTGTLSKFGVMMRFNLKNNVIPIITTKRVYLKGVIEELLWFIRGDTDAKHLQEKGVKIWDDNTSRSYLDKIGLKNNPTGDGGAIYGFQWRHFGVPYRGVEGSLDSEGKKITYAGYDQLKEVIELIRKNPDSRRIILSAWNPPQLKEMCLPPCHVLYQFYVHLETKELSCNFYMRSNDLGLGFPFNIASASLLTHMLAHICGLTARELIYTAGDAHIYNNHVESLRVQANRTPYSFPTIRFTRNVNEIDDFKYEDILIDNYRYHDLLKMKMAV